MNYCFNCGVDLRTLPKEKRTKDHIPPKSLFAGFPELFKLNRKTVDCCYDCNQKFAPLDEKFRNIIGFAFDHIKAISPEMARKAVASLLKNGNLMRESDGTISSTASDQETKEFLKRIFKAVYALTYSEVFPDKLFELDAVHEHDTQDRIDSALQIRQFIEKDGTSGISGNSEMFRYTIKRMNFNGEDEQSEMKTANTIEETLIVGAELIICETYGAVVYGRRVTTVK